MTSPPRTPSSCTSDRRFKYIDDDCEWSEQYRPGGFHPVTLGDTFHDGRYKAIRKLGEGSFSTVWLVVSTSTPKYAALKIVAAKDSAASTEVAVLSHLSHLSQLDPNSQHITTLLDSFQHEGPNGVHQCLVFELMGASVASLLDFLPSSKGERWDANRRYPKAVAKEILFQTLQALSFVHKNGLVHSNLQPGNLLFAIESLDGVEEQQLKQNEAETTVPVQRIDGKVDRWSPRNMYLRETLHDHVKLSADICVKLSDFGVGKDAYH